MITSLMRRREVGLRMSPKIALLNPVQLETQSKWKVSPPDSNPNHIGRRQKGGNNADLGRGGLPLAPS